LANDALADTVAINLVEFIADDGDGLSRQVSLLTKILSRDSSVLAFQVVDNLVDIQCLWALRKKGVGLLANAPGSRQPIPFVEDTAVPPEHLADYIVEFRALLDGFGLTYGMFGHVDVGCLHVRPALDLKDVGDVALLRQLSDAVCALVQKYGGVIWAEHGKGFRSEYVPPTPKHPHPSPLTAATTHASKQPAP